MIHLTTFKGFLNKPPATPNSSALRGKMAWLAKRLIGSLPIEIDTGSDWSLCSAISKNLLRSRGRMRIPSVSGPFICNRLIETFCSPDCGFVQ